VGRLISSTVDPSDLNDLIESGVKELIRILIADDHPIAREGLRSLISTEPGMVIVGEAVDGVDVVAKARDLQPDLTLIDLVMPRQDGIAAIAAIKQIDPEARILVLTSFAQDDKLFPAIKAGALGYLLKDASPTEIFSAIRDVARGESSLHPTIARKVLRELASPQNQPPAKEILTERELEVLRLVADGLPNEDIASRLVVSERTIRTHVSNILAKLDLDNRTQAALYALRKEIVGLDRLKSQPPSMAQGFVP
jgi:NarL family two-component system response regulator LiaR